MATRHTRALAKAAVGPSVLVLFIWMIVPLGLTLWFSPELQSADSSSTPFIGFRTTNIS
jgi:sorbitol/mannitol transport system permease protein